MKMSMPTLHFKGKPFLKNYHHAVKFHNLVAKKESSVSKEPSLDDNLLIQGDNLKALKALLPTHAGKIKCIYIDPPYNTGNENWVYSDNVASPMIQKWLGEAVAKDDLTRHDKWCCMMYPRLTLLRELLRDDGLIFVSIDENEVHHLRPILDEIFGSENFISQIGWQKVYSPKNQSTYLSNDYEFILCYSKNIERASINLLPRTEEMNARYRNIDNDPRGAWKPGDLIANEERKVGHFIVKSTITGKEFNSPQGRHWAFSKQKMEDMLRDNRIYFGKDGNSFPAFKQFISEVKQGRKASSLFLYKDFGHTDEAKKEIKNIFYDHEEIVFDTPKPTRLIKAILTLGSGENDIILDSFAGSGTTGHAVLALNKEDGGNRKFILVECEDYADKITAERLRRVIKGMPAASDKILREGLGGSFSYFQIGEAIEIDKILEGKNLPTYEELAKYVFFTATGERFNSSKINQESYHIGSSNTFEVYLIYEPNKEKLKKLALNLDFAQEINKKHPNKQKLVFAPCCFIEEFHLKEYGIRFAQLPFEIYRIAE